LRVGDFVVAVGNPFGVGQSATSGIVSGLNRTGLGGRGFQNFIQTDATINPGNSGGALVNLRGELVGINSQIYSTSGGSIGIGFAIPSNLAADVMRQLIATGTVKRGTLGVQAQDLTPQIANMLGTKAAQGAVITQVRDNSPADAAGIRPGDIVVAINGKPVNSENDLYNAEGLLPVNSNVELKLLREGKPLTMSVPLAAEQLSSTEGGKLDPRIAGAQLSDVGERVRREGLNGVSVARVAPGSRAAANGLKQGDLIVAVNQVQIAGLADLTSLTAKHPRQLLLAVVRDRTLQFLSMQ
jgi:serine protease DegQ